MSQPYELVMLTVEDEPLGPDKSERRLFGLAPTLDDVPHEVTDTDGNLWRQAYLDTIDCFAIYVRSEA